ncbi:hypothetical protein GGI08_002082, partial [Coemansia sp. S2]
GFASYTHCMGLELTKLETEKLHSVLTPQYFVWMAFYFPIMLALVLLSFSQTGKNALSSPAGLLIVNGTVLAGLAILLAKKRHEEL